MYILDKKNFFFNLSSTVRPLFFEWTMVWSAAAYRKLYLAAYILLPIYKKRPLKEFDPMWHLMHSALKMKKSAITDTLCGHYYFEKKSCNISILKILPYFRINYEIVYYYLLGANSCATYSKTKVVQTESSGLCKMHFFAIFGVLCHEGLLLLVLL